MNGYLVDLLFSFITIGIPECVAITLLALTLLRQSYHWRRVLQISILLAIAVFACRFLIHPYGVPGMHTAMATLILALLISLFYQTPKHLTLAVSIICLAFITLCELLIYQAFAILFSLEISALANQKLLWLIVNWLHIIAAALIAFWLSKTKWYMKSGAINH